MADRYDYKITVPGEPGAQKRHRSAIRQRKGKLGYMVSLDDGRNVRLFEKKDFFIHNYDLSGDDKRNFAKMVIPFDKPLLGPLQVDTYFYYQYRQGDYGTGRNAGKVKASAPLWKITKPDIDNAAKFVFDALNGILWHDDSQICAGEILQQYSETPRTEIYITQLTQTERNNHGEEENLYAEASGEGRIEA